jgi:type I restriction enzyme S subunit
MSHLHFDYVPLTFISDPEEIKKQIRNTLILIHLFEKYNSPTRLENLIYGTQYGYNASALKSGKNKFLRISDIHESKVNWKTVPYCNCDDEEIYLLKKDDILIARTGGTTGKSFKIDNPPAHSIYAGYLIRIRAKQEVDPDYVYLFLHSFAYWSQIVNLNEGNFRPKANAENLKSLIIPDCSKHIQNDAVKISKGEFVKGYEALYALIERTLDEYDKTQEVQRLLSHQLILLENLNQAILQQAVQGKLVEQAPNDEPASNLLKRIKAEKAKSGKKEKTLQPIKPEEIPFDIPETWVWCRLGSVTEITMGQSPAGSSYNEKGIGFPLINGPVEFGGKGAFDETVAIKFTTEPTKYCKKGDLLICVRGSTTGRTNIAGFDACIGRGVAAISACVYDRFIHYYILFVRKRILGLGKGSTFPNVSQEQLLTLYTPLPPLFEQKRIVAEIEKQFAQTKLLKEYIIVNQQATEQLLKALLHRAFELKETGEPIIKSNEKIIEITTKTIGWDNLAAAPFEKRAAQPVNIIQNIDWEIALMVACMKNKLGVTYGDVGLQKNVFNTNYLQPIFSKQYDFINSNFGTYSPELKDDLKRNPYLISKKVANNKEVYIVNPKYSKQVLNKLSAPENKAFVQVIDNMLSIYEQPFINKETDKIELYNTVLKVAIDKRTTDINVIYHGMKNWKINQPTYKTKAEKFSKSESEKMLQLLIEKGIL